MTTMCGLLAFFSARGDAAAQRDAIAGALECLHHRGPDETGVEAVRLATRSSRTSGCRSSTWRSATSRCPTRPGGRYLLTFNGEIYNYIELREELIRDFGARVRHRRATAR